MMDSENITTFLPQQPPFIMVGKLLQADEKITISGFTVEENNILVEDGLFTEAGLLENIAQTAAAGAGYKAAMENKPVLNGYIAQVKNFLLFGLPKVNDELKTEVSQEGSFSYLQTVQGKVWCGEKLLAQCEMKIFLQEESTIKPALQTIKK
jgi:predicted hotdog family 3-hydroxylacyl-ACP dehydratase